MDELKISLISQIFQSSTSIMGGDSGELHKVNRTLQSVKDISKGAEPKVRNFIHKLNPASPLVPYNHFKDLTLKIITRTLNIRSLIRIRARSNHQTVKSLPSDRVRKITETLGLRTPLHDFSSYFDTTLQFLYTKTKKTHGLKFETHLLLHLSLFLKP